MVSLLKQHNTFLLTSVQDHELALARHLLSGDASRLRQGSFQSTRSPDVNLGLAALVLEDDGVGAEGHVPLEELIVSGGDLRRA